MIHYNRQKSRARLLAGDVPDWIRNSSRRDYITAVVLSCPPWVSNKDLLALSAEAAVKTLATGVLHHLDHIIPLKHSMVCGLTVPWNLRVITQRQNMAKSNKWHPDQLDLFTDDPEFPY